jgi:hypothetical protein
VLATLAAGPDVPAQDDLSFAGAKLVMPFGAGAFPTGRFGETDLEAEPPKSGHDAGYGAGVAVGLFLNEFLAVGIEGAYSQFPIDFGPEFEALYPTSKAHTSILSGQAWLRVFLANSFEHWRPYAVVAAGFGRPKGTIDYEQPFIIEVDENQNVEVKSAESTVSTSVEVSGGIGAMIPLSRSFSLMIEPRFNSVSSKGTDRTDRFTGPDGDVTESQAKAKANTNWWEIRGGLVLTIH